MPTVIGKLSQDELERLHPDKVQKAIAEDLRPPEHVLRLSELPEITEADWRIQRPKPVRAKTGVMVLIELGHSHCDQIIYATDFNLWTDPDGPTLREAQAFRATCAACRNVMRRATIDGFGISQVLSNEQCEEIVHSMIAKGAWTMRVLDVPAEAFA